MFIVKIELSKNEDNTSAKFTVQTEKESFKEDNELFKKFVWQQINGKFDISKEDKDKFDIENVFLLIMSPVYYSKRKDKQTQIS